MHGTENVAAMTLEREAGMSKCEACGIEYDKSFQVTSGGQTHTFDSFECLIHAGVTELRDRA